MSQGDSLVTVKVLFFAKARELSGENETKLEVIQNIRASDLFDLIIRKFNLTAIEGNVILALNQNWIDLNSVLTLNNEDELAIIPPLSGEKQHHNLNWLIGAVEIGRSRHLFLH